MKKFPKSATLVGSQARMQRELDHDPEATISAGGEWTPEDVAQRALDVGIIGALVKRNSQDLVDQKTVRTDLLAEGIFHLVQIPELGERQAATSTFHHRKYRVTGQAESARKVKGETVEQRQVRCQRVAAVNGNDKRPMHLAMAAAHINPERTAKIYSPDARRQKADGTEVAGKLASFGQRKTLTTEVITAALRIDPKVGERIREIEKRTDELRAELAKLDKERSETFEEFIAPFDLGAPPKENEEPYSPEEGEKILESFSGSLK
jgi:hypothetical protein